MKNSTFAIILFLFIALSCSDENTSNNSNAFEIPINIDNYWIYDVKSGTVDTRDSLYIANDTVIGSTLFKKCKTQNNFASGFYTTSLRNNGIRLQNKKLYLSGNLAISANTNLPLELDITLDDFIIFNSNASNNQALNSSPKTGTINQTYDGYPLTINYSLQSYGGEAFTTYTLPDQTVFTNIKTTKIKVKIEITTMVSGISIPVLSNQDVLISTLYVANGIGVIYTNTVTSYNLNTSAAGFLGIPATNTQTQEEFLNGYLVN